MNTIKFDQKADCKISRNRGIENFCSPKGIFTLEHWRNGKLLSSHEIKNGVTNEGKDFILDVMFHGTTAAPTWWLGLIDLAGYSALADADDYDNINGTNGWDEFDDYGTTDRIVWNEAAASAQSITNSANVATFNITATGTVKGVFLVGLGANADKQNDHAADGKLWATALLSGGDVSVLNSDQLKITYTVNA